MWLNLNSESIETQRERVALLSSAKCDRVHWPFVELSSTHSGSLKPGTKCARVNATSKQYICSHYQPKGQLLPILCTWRAKQTWNIIWCKLYNCFLNPLPDSHYHHISTYYFVPFVKINDQKHFIYKELKYLNVQNSCIQQHHAKQLEILIFCLFVYRYYFSFDWKYVIWQSFFPTLAFIVNNWISITCIKKTRQVL